ncbi:N-lysine methyltransferase setd6-like [Lolium rigidum]|uniref:N-lysine methyltransferase setd6-like n=1 Tax=Lolium rigidum TaxID=89674 RepID=UPI001F5C117D|nr:N-lysine methyltransferase setd6-like [Lolium rigidum]
MVKKRNTTAAASSTSEEAANIPVDALERVANNSPSNDVSMVFASHQLTQELLMKGKSVLAQIHSMIFPKINQEKNLGQMIDSFAVNTKEAIEVFPVPSFTDDSSGALSESDRIQRMKDRMTQMEKDLRSTYALAAIINKKGETAAAVERRRLGAFQRWMRKHGVACSDALCLDASEAGGVYVRAVAALREGDVVATIPRRACLTPRTSGAAAAIEAAQLGGTLALAVAVMYERARGAESPWKDYLRLIPDREPVPLVWPDDEADRLLTGTELDKTVKQDRGFLREDWKECIEPLISSGELGVEPEDLSLEKYFAAKSLLSSRSFHIDRYHGSGMVPLADLFNHKTDSEHVHFTKSEESDSDEEEDDDDQSNADSDQEEDDDDQSNASADKQSTVKNSTTKPSGEGHNDEDLEMIIVRDANPGDEVYNTYGTMGNAALLHRYGFTEPDNPYDIVNVDLTLVTKWCSSKYSRRYARERVSLWQKLGYSGCTGDDADYFEISYDGEPQLELLILLYVISLKPDAYNKLVCVAHDLIDDDDQEDEEEDTINSFVKIVGVIKPAKISELNGVEELPDAKQLLHSESICTALASLADIREGFYGSNTLKDDKEQLQACSPVSERNRYHSLVLRVSERKILGRLRKHVSSWSKTKNKKRKHL